MEEVLVDPTGNTPDVASQADLPQAPRRENGYDTAGWETSVKERLSKTNRDLEHNHKRAVTFGGIALGLAAAGAALLVNGILAPGAALVLRSWTLVTICLLTSALMAATRAVVVRRESRASVRERVAGPTGWVVLDVVSVITATLGLGLLLSRAIGSGQPDIFRFAHGALGTAFLSAALGFMAIAIYYTGKSRRNEQHIGDLQFEQDLLRYRVEPFESRAEKLLSVNQIQLRRYYELNLQQAKAVFIVGVCCVAAGLAVIGLTFWLVYWLGTQSGGRPESSQFAQIVIAIVGAVGTVLTNYVAALYFKMHAAIGESLMRFHRQLAATNDLYFANVLASGIRNADQRSETTMRLVQAIAGRHGETDGRGEVPRPAEVPRP